MKIKLKAVLITGIIIVLIFLGYIQSSKKLENVDKTIDFKENELYIAFTEEFLEREVILCESGDFTNDGIEDLIVIYKEKKHTEMLVAVGGENKIMYTNTVKAPVENQSIELRDIDSKDEMEFVVSGSKAGNVGYGIFRVENMILKDLFGEGMDACC